MSKLNDALIRALKPGPRDLWEGDGNGLWLRVRTSGTKVFVLRRKRGGKQRVTTLGEWPSVTLAAARLEAAKQSADRSGRALRPVEVISVAALANEYFERRIAGRYKRTKSARTYRDKLIAELGWRRVTEIVARDLARVVTEYAKATPVAANRFLSFSKQVFDYGVQAGYIEASPAVALTRAVAGGEEVSRERVLLDEELRRLWHAPGAHTPLLRFLLLTGCRIGEAQTMTWGHIDLSAQRWNQPAHLNKAGRAHWVHLTAPAIGLLGPPGRISDRPLRSSSDTAVQAWLRRWCARENIAPAFTPHDLRRTFATRLGELGAAPHIIAKSLNHALDAGGASTAVYLRAEFAAERIEVSKRWAQRLLEVVHATEIELCQEQL